MKVRIKTLAQMPSDALWPIDPRIPRGWHDNAERIRPLFGTTVTVKQDRYDEHSYNITNPTGFAYISLLEYQFDVIPTKLVSKRRQPNPH